MIVVYHNNLWSMSVSELTERLNTLQKSGDTEAAHMEADEILLVLVSRLANTIPSLHALIAAYQEVPKRYA